jgi:2-keto-3-deoxy-L-rhamnonate aldolase RhmA
VCSIVDQTKAIRKIFRPTESHKKAACLIYEDELTAHRCFRFGNNLLRESSTHIELRQSSYQHIDRLKLKKMPAAARTHFDVAGNPSRN